MNRRRSPIKLLAAVCLIAPAVGASRLPKETLQVAITSLQDSNVDVRVAAAQALGQAGDSVAVKPLETALIASAVPTEQAAIAQALEVLNDKNSFKRLSDALANPQFTWGAGAKAKAVEVMGTIGDHKAIKALTTLAAGDQESAVKAAALRALGKIGAPPKKKEEEK